ncbi:MAG: family transposase [Bradyrhizobium sp.]|nr:family transposase [Bradyrhizobium sp.]
MCPAYIAGPIGPGDRKSVQPMAARDADVSYDRLHHFIASRVWDAALPKKGATRWAPRCNMPRRLAPAPVGIADASI